MNFGRRKYNHLQATRKEFLFCYNQTLLIVIVFPGNNKWHAMPTRVVG